MTTTETKWLRCHVDKGMFSDEVAVTYPPEGSYRKSVFVPRSDVAGEGASGRVRVDVTQRDGKTYATLPSSRRDMVTVETADLC